MPRTKNLQHYPARYSEIIRECGLEGKRVEICGMGIKAGNSLRGHWYAYIGALKEEAARQRRGAMPANIELLDLERVAPMTMIQVIDIGNGLCNVVWQNRELSWQALAVAGATVTQSEAKPTATGLDDAAARLAALQQQVDKGDGDGSSK